MSDIPPLDPSGNKRFKSEPVRGQEEIINERGVREDDDERKLRELYSQSPQQEFNEPMDSPRLREMENAQNRRLELERRMEAVPPSPFRMMTDIYHLKENVDNLYDKVATVEVNTKSLGRELGKVVQQQKTTFNTLNFKIDQLEKTIHKPQQQQSSSRNLNAIYENDNNNNNNPPSRSLRSPPLIPDRQQRFINLIADSPPRRNY